MAAEKGTRADRESTIRRPNVVHPLREVATEENASDQRVWRTPDLHWERLVSASRKPSGRMENKSAADRSLTRFRYASYPLTRDDRA